MSEKNHEKNITPKTNKHQNNVLKLSSNLEESSDLSFKSFEQKTTNTYLKQQTRI